MPSMESLTPTAEITAFLAATTEEDAVAAAAALANTILIYHLLLVALAVEWQILKWPIQISPLPQSPCLVVATSVLQSQ